MPICLTKLLHQLYGPSSGAVIVVEPADDVEKGRDRNRIVWTGSTARIHKRLTYEPYERGVTCLRLVEDAPVGHGATEDEALDDLRTQLGQVLAGEGHD